MTLSLNNLTASVGTTKGRRRVGRGNGSGIGTYCGKGLKGQKCRSGVSGLKRLGMKQMLMSVPKKRGFTSRHPKNQVINLFDLNKNFKEGQTVNPKTLRGAKLVDNMDVTVKILGKGELKVNGLIFENVLISDTVKEQITKSKGIVK